MNPVRGVDFCDGAVRCRDGRDEGQMQSPCFRFWLRGEGWDVIRMGRVFAKMFARKTNSCFVFYECSRRIRGMFRHENGDDTVHIGIEGHG